MFKLIWRNTIRHPLRASLTWPAWPWPPGLRPVRTMVAAWYAGVEGASPTRLVTRNAISLIYPLPMAYLVKIRACPGGSRGLRNWFGGNYKDEKQFFPSSPWTRYASISRSTPNSSCRWTSSSLFPGPPGPAGRALPPLRLAPGRLHHPQGQHLSRGMAVLIRAIYTGAESTTDEGRFIFTGNT